MDKTSQFTNHRGQLSRADALEIYSGMDDGLADRAKVDVRAR